MAFNLVFKRNYDPLNDRFYVNYFSGPTKAGVEVDEESALRAVAVFACVDVIASALASLPLPVYRQLQPRGKERALNHYAYNMLHTKPNPEQTSFVWRHVSMAHILLWGNCYSEIEFNSSGMPVALWPLPPWRVTPRRTNLQGDLSNRRAGDLFYQVKLNNGLLNLPAFNVLHIKGLSTDGVSGKSRIQEAREAVGLTLAAEEFGGRFFGQGANVGAVVSHPKVLTKQAHDNIEGSLNRQYAGLGTSHRIMLLEEGMKYEKAGIPPDDAQFLETRKFQKGDIATLFRVPPHLIGDLEKATFSNIEQQSLDFLIHTMRPWLVNWEQEINDKILRNGSNFFAEFLAEGFLRGDSTARSDYYQKMFYIGAMSPNDIREKENLNPVEGGDDYYVQINMMPMGEAGKQLQEPDGQDQQNQMSLRSKKAQGRCRLAQSFRPVLENTVGDIVKREAAKILKAAKEHLGQRDLVTWDVWLERFYIDFPDYIRKTILPAFMKLAEIIAEASAGETNQKETPQVDNFVNKYTDAFVKRYSGSSEAQMRWVLKKALEENADPLEAIAARLGEWGERRAGKIAMNEAVSLSNAVAKIVFAAAGITKLVWANTSGKSCDFCRELDGQVVGIGSNFHTQGLEAAGHPPIHEGCECQILPG